MSALVESLVTGWGRLKPHMESSGGPYGMLIRAAGPEIARMLESIDQEGQESIRQTLETWILETAKAIEREADDNQAS